MKNKNKKNLKIKKSSGIVCLSTKLSQVVQSPVVVSMAGVSHKTLILILLICIIFGCNNVTPVKTNLGETGIVKGNYIIKITNDGITYDTVLFKENK